MRAILARSLLSCVLLAVPATAQTFSVGPGGDFPGVATALASPLVVEGATLVVAPGSYADFTVDKAVRILGTDAFAQAVAVVGVPSFVLSGFETNQLAISNVGQKGLVTGCVVRGIGLELAPYDADLEIRDSHGIVVERTTVTGVSACYPGGPDSASNAVAVVASEATFVDCALVGGDDTDEFFECETHYPTAGAGLVVAKGSVVDVVATAVVGHPTWTPEYSAPGLWALDGSVVDVRGRSSDVVRGGTEYAALVDSTSLVVFSGVTLDPPTAPPFTVTEGRGFLRVDGPFTPGGALTVARHAAPGTLAWTSFCAIPGPAPAPFLGGELWLDAAALGSLLPSAGSGLDSPATLALTVPPNPGLIGATLAAQTLAFDGAEFDLWSPYLAVIE